MSVVNDEADLKHKLISGAKWATILRILAQLISWLVTIVVVRYLTPDDYGLNAMLEVPIELLMLFSTIGLDMALIQRRAHSDEELAASFGMLLAINGVFFVVLLGAADIIAAYFNEPRLGTIIRVASLVFVLVPFRTIPNALLDRELAFKLKSQVELFAAVVSALLSLILAISGAGVWALVGAMLCNAGLRAALLMFIKPWFIKPSFKFSAAKKLLHYGGVIAISGAVLVMSGKAVNVIAGPVLGVESLGFYAVAGQFAILPLSRVMPIVQQTLYPAFARVQGQQELACAYFLKGVELSSLVIYPMAIGLACISEQFVATFFGSKWLPMALPLALLSLVTPIRMITNIYAPAMNALGVAREVLWINTAMFAMLALGTPLAMQFGILGLAVLWVFVSPTIMGLSMLLGRKVLPIRWQDLGTSLLPATVASASMAVALLMWRWIYPAMSGGGHLAETIVLGGVIYFAVLYGIFPTRMRLLKAGFSGR
ncbi:MAG TPA: lipopolysaccharide biosynthesis protein [Rhodocyclaceae bacterium]|nr:lipopolysaccharide biosynthesis protein [Rhodocyclaceae bacterium]